MRFTDADDDVPWCVHDQQRRAKLSDHRRVIRRGKFFDEAPCQAETAPAQFDFDTITRQFGRVGKWLDLSERMLSDRRGADCGDGNHVIQPSSRMQYRSTAQAMADEQGRRPMFARKPVRSRDQVFDIRAEPAGAVIAFAFT